MARPESEIMAAVKVKAKRKAPAKKPKAKAKPKKRAKRPVGIGTDQVQKVRAMIDGARPDPEFRGTN